MVWVKAFIAGFLATVVFHQGAVALLWLAGLIGGAPWNMTAVPPFAIPKVISLAFWGGVWGLPVWWLIRRWNGSTQDRKSTRLNSSHVRISYAVFCLKKKKKND